MPITYFASPDFNIYVQMMADLCTNTAKMTSSYFGQRKPKCYRKSDGGTKPSFCNSAEKKIDVEKTSTQFMDHCLINYMVYPQIFDI